MWGILKENYSETEDVYYSKKSKTNWRPQTASELLERSFFPFFCSEPPKKLGFFPTCQVRVVRFYVSVLLLFLFLLLLLFFLVVLRRIVCQTITAIMRGQCGAPDLNRDHARSVWRAGPQPRLCEASVACRTSTAIM